MKRAKKPSESVFPVLTPYAFKILCKRRRALKLSQQLVADKTGLSRSKVCAMEAGKRPRMSMSEIEIVANVLGMTLQTLLALADQYRLEKA